MSVVTKQVLSVKIWMSPKKFGTCYLYVKLGINHVKRLYTDQWLKMKSFALDASS